jgi:8-oxo-dGTP pyrophosphatase MutT (NUDIX family)
LRPMIRPRLHLSARPTSACSCWTRPTEVQRKTLSAGVVVLRHEPKGCRYLLLRAYQYWDFPKGLVEPGEEPKAAACREVEEETTLTELVFRWGERYRETGPYGHGKVARYYIAETPQIDVSLPVNPELGRPEHSEFRWMSYEEAMTLLSPRVASVLKWAHEVTGCTTVGD